jgi:hypothetical protein
MLPGIAALGFTALHPTYDDFGEIAGILGQKPSMDSCNIVVSDRPELHISLRLSRSSDNQFSVVV